MTLSFNSKGHAGNQFFFFSPLVFGHHYYCRYFTVYNIFYNHYSPISLDVSAGSNVVLRGQDKLIVQHPLRLVVQTSRWMQLYNLKNQLLISILNKKQN